MSVRKAAIWAMGAQYCAFLIQFAASVIIARCFLTPAEVGLFSIAFAIMALLSTLQDLGLTRYLVGKPELGPEDIRASFTVALIFGVGVAALVAAIAWPAALFYGDLRLVPLLLVVGCTFLFLPFSVVPNALLQREMDFASLFIVNVGAALTLALVSVSLAAAGFSAMALAWALLAQFAMRSFLAVWRVGWRMHFRPSLSNVKPVLRFGSAMSLLSVSGAVGGRTPDLIIGRLISFTAVGLWSRAISLADQLRFLLAGAIGSVFYPAFARLRDRGEDLAPPYLKVVAAYSAIMWPAMLFLGLASLPVVLLLFGPTWEGVAPLLLLIAVSELALAGIPLQMELPILLGKMRLLLALNIIDTAVSVATLLIGALWSLEAAAASRILYTAIWWVIYAGLLHRLIGLKWAALFDIYWRSMAVALAAIAPLLEACLSWGGVSGVPLPWLAVSVPAGALCWLAALFLVRHPARHEIAAFAGLMRNRFGRRPVAAPAE
jgi:O-antigen/teichoic acid export membrane protein